MSSITAPINSVVLPTAVPALAPNLDLSPDQWKTLLALCDAVIPRVLPGHKADDQEALYIEEHEYSNRVKQLRDFGLSNNREDIESGFLGENPSSIPAFKAVLRGILFRGLAPDNLVQLVRILSVLGNSAGSLVLTGRTTTIANQSLRAREQVLQSWYKSRISSLRLLAGQITLLSKQVWARTSPTLHATLGFPHVPIEGRLGDNHDFQFIQIPPGNEPEVIETDVIIVGSGCGGGVCAKNLSEAGLRVLVVDKGYHWSSEHLPMTPEQAPSQMFANGGSILSDDGSIAVISGETWGGGGTVNWSASLQTQGYVRREWAATGLPLFSSAAFQESLDRVFEVMGVNTSNIRHSIPNKILMESSRKLGWAHKEVPQNTGHTDHTCGSLCSMGCRASTKQGPTVSWLPKAAAAGAKFVEGFDVQRVLFENRAGQRVAVGVRGVWKARDQNGGVAGTPVATREVIIKARRVIVSCGTLQSPLLLLRSGLKNKNIGKNLYLHPVALVGATYDEEMLPWEGPILSTVCSEFENLDGRGHGVKLETTSMTPYSWLTWLPWAGGLQWKQNAAKMRHMAGYISVSRDRDTGMVYPDATDGRCHIQYHPSRLDKRHILEGLIALARMNYEAGAREIFATVPGAPVYVRRQGNVEDGSAKTSDDQLLPEADFEDWVSQLRSHGFPSPESLFVSAHQMGTCRMSAAPSKGVVDKKGQVWGAEGLYVADASVFPSASGVNPSVTVMAIADYLSRTMAAGWTKEKI